jgi:hypothetical protein
MGAWQESLQSAKWPKWVASLGARSRTKVEISSLGKQGGRPTSLDRKALARLETLLHQGKCQAEYAKVLGISFRTIRRAVART